MSLQSINTDRLMLFPITLEITVELLKQQTSAVEKQGFFMDSSWPTADTMDILPIIHETLKENKPSGFETWLIIRKDTKQIIGDIGFHGKPNEQGEAEIGYGIVENQWGQGFGYEAVKAIFSWALTKESVRVLKAGCLITNVRSARILEKIGMQQVRCDKDLLYWEYSR